MGFGLGQWWRSVILVCISCGLAMVVCDFGLDKWWVSSRGLWILVWIGEVGLLWFEQRFCGSR